MIVTVKLSSKGIYTRKKNKIDVYVNMTDHGIINVCARAHIIQVCLFIQMKTVINKALTLIAFYYKQINSYGFFLLLLFRCSD